MLFDTERARYLSEEYESQVSAEHLQQALRTAQNSRPAAIEHRIEHGLFLVDWLVRSIEQWGENVTTSMRWLLSAYNR